MRYLSRSISVAALGLALATAMFDSAAALPATGARRPNVVLVDAWDRVLNVGQLGAKPVLVVYEDRGSSAQNAALKAELAELARGDRYKAKVALVPIADVGGYDYWPVRGFVKDAIRGESVKAGATIFCDWSGGARTALGVQRGVSSVILYDRAGRVAWSHEGVAPKARRAELIALLHGMVGDDEGAKALTQAAAPAH